MEKIEIRSGKRKEIGGGICDWPSPFNFGAKDVFNGSGKGLICGRLAKRGDVSKQKRVVLRNWRCI